MLSIFRLVDDTLKYSKLDQNGSKMDPKWIKMGQNGSKWIKQDHIGSNWTKNGPKWIQLNPIGPIDGWYSKKSYLHKKRFEIPKWLFETTTRPWSRHNGWRVKSQGGISISCKFKKHLHQKDMKTGVKTFCCTGKSFSKGLILANPQYDKSCSLNYEFSTYMKITSSEHAVYINCFLCVW